jgi:hypothetical protein
MPWFDFNFKDGDLLYILLDIFTLLYPQINGIVFFFLRKLFIMFATLHLITESYALDLNYVHLLDILKTCNKHIIIFVFSKYMVCTYVNCF